MLGYPSDETRLSTQAAMAGVEGSHQAGVSFSKSETFLLSIIGG